MNLRSKKFQNLFLAMMLIVAMALTAAGCKTKVEAPKTPAQAVENSDAGQQASDAVQNQNGDDVTVLGEGRTVISFTVVDQDGKETRFEIHTDKEIVGDALLEHGLIAGDESEYGLYVKQVNGITADYDVDKTYWAFYINGEYATSGVDSTDIKEGDAYTFKVEK